MPAPPARRSAPRFPITQSSPVPPLRLSSPASPRIDWEPEPPLSTSLRGVPRTLCEHGLTGSGGEASQLVGVESTRRETSPRSDVT